MKMRAMLVLGLLLILQVLVEGAVHAQGPQPLYESYVNYINDVPHDRESDYAHKVQGITHDANHWFISQEKTLRKVHVSLDLGYELKCNKHTPQVICTNIGAWPQLRTGIDHIGDIDYYRYKSTGFLLLPIEDGDDRVHPVLAIFDPVNLHYIDHVELPEHGNLPWVAVDPDGRVYLANKDRKGWIYIYDLNWDVLYRYGRLLLQKVGEFPLFDKEGVMLNIDGQGAVFSESGNLLYLTSGNDEDYNSRTDGINVFDMKTHRRVAQSLNWQRCISWFQGRCLQYEEECSGWPFCYYYKPGGLSFHEPEGLTIWDLDDGRAPNVSGQLHVLLLNNDECPEWYCFVDDSDNVYIKHYTNKIYVDRSYNGTERGKPDRPFDTVGEANTMAWNGAALTIKKGSYPESLTISKRVMLQAVDGPAIIGQ